MVHIEWTIGIQDIVGDGRRKMWMRRVFAPMDEKKYAEGPEREDWTADAVQGDIAMSFYSGMFNAMSSSTSSCPTLFRWIKLLNGNSSIAILTLQWEAAER